MGGFKIYPTNANTQAIGVEKLMIDEPVKLGPCPYDTWDIIREEGSKYTIKLTRCGYALAILDNNTTDENIIVVTEPPNT